MAFNQGTIQSETPGPELAQAVSSVLISAGWIVEDEFTFESGASACRVFSTPGSVETPYVLSLRWRVADAGYFTMSAAESYDEANRQFVAPLSQGVYSRANILAPKSALADGTAWSNAILESQLGSTIGHVPGINAPDSNGGPPSFAAILPANEPFAYWFKATTRLALLGTLVSNETARTGGFTTIDYNPDLGDTTVGALMTQRAVFSLTDFPNELTSGATVAYANASSIVVQPEGWNQHYANTNTISPRGTIVPTLEGPVDAQAIRLHYFVANVTRTSSGTPFLVGDRVVLGSGVEGWLVSGGQTGDTLDIDGVPHLLFRMVENPGSYGPATPNTFAITAD